VVKLISRLKLSRSKFIFKKIIPREADRRQVEDTPDLTISGISLSLEGRRFVRIPRRFVAALRDFQYTIFTAKTFA
jgi:hypothetical protein